MPQVPAKQFPFVAGAYAARSPNFDNQRCVNLYPEISGSGNSKSLAMLIGTPGLLQFSNSQVASNVRGMLVFNSTYAIYVNGPRVYRITSAGSLLLLGLIEDLTTPVSMASNGTLVMLVSGLGKSGVFIDPVAGTFTVIADPDFIGADRVDFINGYFVFNKPGTQQYQITTLFGTDITALNFASAEGSPDLLVSLIVDHKEVWLMGETTTEVHIDSGNADFPFEPIQGAFIEQGCAAAFSVAKMTDGSGAGTIIMLSKNENGQGMFVKFVGYQPVRISDHALEFAIQNYSRIDDAIAYTYQQEGHSFYVCSFPTANKTWAYDTSTEFWHERAWRNPIDGSLNRHRSNCHMFFGGKHLVGDAFDGTIWELKLDYYADGADPLPAIRQCPHLSNGSNDWQIFDELWIDMETGVGLSGDPTVPSADPTLILEWSDDGAHTFPNSRLIKIGKLGEYRRRAVARRLGKSRDRVFRATITDFVKRCFIGAGVRLRGA